MAANKTTVKVFRKVTLRKGLKTPDGFVLKGTEFYEDQADFPEWLEKEIGADEERELTIRYTKVEEYEVLIKSEAEETKPKAKVKPKAKAKLKTKK